MKASEPDIQIKVTVTEVGPPAADGTSQCAVAVSPEGKNKPTRQQAVMALMLALDSLHGDLSEDEWEDCARTLKQSRETREHLPEV